ncbi:MAG: ATP-binding cassette domain-containing protein [Saprospiraceae bacterium]|jgi:ABC-2 type transport system ATP-binding protein|nr:ATP-binding cassette domain-containing protein [Saprospiraceae bacterium]MBP9209705.1 ATP-binding cassette domain-containing protein [Saprospiraceae bacterium]MBV6474120.1 Vitamin B12 import ATP-binding protein BtuD [Saprospiraceae bacterium]
MSVIVRDLSKSFGHQTAVDQLGFSAQKGEVLGFLGPNGAGKTTTMKMICGFLRPDSGRIEVCGMDVGADPIRSRAHIGYLPENNPLYKDMYVREFLQFFGRLCKTDRLDRRIDQLIAATGLGNEQNKLIGSLSKGYRQRVGLCQALINDPEVLILDEPTSGLDPNQLVGIRQLIREIGSEKTLIFSSHIMQEVQALCDRVIILSKGRLVADAPIAQLMHLRGNGLSIIVEFTQPVPDEFFTGISGITRRERLGKSSFRLHCKAGADPRDAVFQKAAATKLSIRELREEKSSVEEVFNLLTSDQSDVGPV